MRESRITILVEDTAAKPHLEAEHGLSLWIEYNDRRILFDAGQSNLLIRNAAMLAIAPDQADAIVISHGHYDHTGGLPAVLSPAAKAAVYLHPAAVEPKYSQKAAGATYIGMSEATRKAIHARRCVQTIQPAQILSGVFVTGQVPRTNDFENVGGDFFLDRACTQPDEVIDDQALFFDSADGLIVLFGCAHAGVVNVLNYIRKISGCGKIAAVIGGMHLLHADSSRIQKTIAVFKQYQVQKVIPLHCTGCEAKKAFQDAFGNRCIFTGAGEQIQI